MYHDGFNDRAEKYILYIDVQGKIPCHSLHKCISNEVSCRFLVLSARDSLQRDSWLWYDESLMV
jgi:hypothetical protein